MSQPFTTLLSVFLDSGVATGGLFFPSGMGMIFLNEVSCGGNESTLADCLSYQEIGQNYCQHNSDAGVICQSKPEEMKSEILM